MVIGDEIKVIPESYFALSKGFFLYPDTWKNSNRYTDKLIMLGGEYKILDIIGQHAKLLDYNENYAGMCHLSNMIGVRDISSCPYVIGDAVSFSPKCSEKEKKYLSILDGYSFNKNKRYEIKLILNNFYIFIDFDITNASAFPFKWNDFNLNR